METPKKKVGRKKVDAANKKQSYTISLSPTEIIAIEGIAQKAGVTVSELVISKLKISSFKPGQP